MFLADGYKELFDRGREGGIIRLFAQFEHPFKTLFIRQGLGFRFPEELGPPPEDLLQLLFSHDEEIEKLGTHGRFAQAGHRLDGFIEAAPGNIEEPVRAILMPLIGPVLEGKHRARPRRTRSVSIQQENGRLLKGQVHRVQSALDGFGRFVPLVVAAHHARVVVAEEVWAYRREVGLQRVQEQVPGNGEHPGLRADARLLFQIAANLGCKQIGLVGRSHLPNPSFRREGV